MPISAAYLGISDTENKGFAWQHCPLHGFSLRKDKSGHGKVRTQMAVENTQTRKMISLQIEGSQSLLTHHPYLFIS